MAGKSDRKSGVNKGLRKNRSSASLALSFAKSFERIYSRHRWPRVKGAIFGRAWTQQMSRVLDKTARNLGLVARRDELKRVDFTWYRTKTDAIPVIVLEHENGWKNVFDEEIPKLMASNAELKVLVCYPPSQQQDKIAKRLVSILRTADRVQRLKEEFLLVMGRPSMDLGEPRQFNINWCRA